MKKIVKIGVAAAAVAGIGYLAYRGLKKLVEKADCCACCDGDCDCHCHEDTAKCCCECNADVTSAVEEPAEAEVTVETEETAVAEEKE